jgi:hypothetical protein
MATARVQTVTGDWSTGSTLTASITATNGNLLAVSIHFIANNSSNSFATFSDGTNTYTEIDRSEAVLGGDNTGLVTGYAKNITGGALTVTATMNTSVIDRARLVVEEISGCDTTAPLNVHAIQHQAAPGTGTDAVTSGAVTASAGDYVYAACIDFFSGSPVLAHGTGFTDGMNAAVWATEFIANFAGGSKAGTFTTSSGSLDFFTAVAMFKAAAGGGGSVLGSYYYEKVAGMIP